MGKSFGFKKIKKSTYIIFMMVILLGWGMNLLSQAAVVSASASVADGSAQEIPKESIRLRILANSDSDFDQKVKREIRDKVVDQVNTWVAALEDPQSLEQARAKIKKHLSDIETLVGDELAARNQKYSYKVELGVVPFPTKMYGDQVYPAGNYEALRITLGKGEGQNWWCVLFPPLCFIDAGTGEAVAQATDTEGAPLVSNGSTSNGSADAVDAGETEVRFFLWDWIVKVFDFVMGLFS
ncbi:stage II sporulation protein R [Paenibacillus selenitireducens]|uniref:Stage II sporulation protein R n=1 Tax=Paenibacillus selenitireducens TaxID=1324314 RepID=A0A1T2X820_9BACL|nr:stage II sporulation protein R [Paenibacillus selenitireducens]OPA75733.1 stage II sporulation protein R [Paenibacillus selenitireducens]